MFGGVALVIFIYVVLNLAVLHVLPIARVAGDPLPLGTAIRQIWGAHADTALQAVVIVSMLSAINAFHLMGCRILFALSRDRLFTQVANQVNAGGTPNAALLMTAAAAIAFIASGTFEKVIAVTAFFFVFNYIVDLLAVIALRRREPRRARPYRAWGYPWTTGLALLGSFGFIAGVIYEDRRNSVYAVLILLASYPVFLATRRLRQP
jgi:APA family basic amino acid/polyamine antiporter